MLPCVRQKCLAQGWQTVGNGFEWFIRDINPDVSTNSLYISGDFKYCDTTAVYGVINWNGNQFNFLNPPVNTCINHCYATGSMLKYHNRLFMNGHYGPYNGRQEQLFEYINNNWQVSGTIANGHIECLRVINDKLFALGRFDSLCHKNTKSIAVFNGIDWDNFNGINSNFRFMAGEYYKGEYYFAGDFGGGNGMQEIIRWNGTQWSSLKMGVLGSFAWVTSLKVYKDILYVGGYFLKSDGNVADCLMAWDGQNWFNPFPQIIYLNTVYDLEVINNQLYISGNYIIPADNDSSMYILARYNDCDLNVFGGEYIYPEYEQAPNTIAGLNGSIYAGVVDTFQHQLAKYLVSIPESTPNLKTIHITDCPTGEVNFNCSVFPNPYSDNITVQISNDFNLSETKIFITNNLGQLLFTFYPNIYNQLLNLSSLSAGMYFLTVEDNENKKTGKIVKD